MLRAVEKKAGWSFFQLRNRNILESILTLCPSFKTCVYTHMHRDFKQYIHTVQTHLLDSDEDFLPGSGFLWQSSMKEGKAPNKLIDPHPRIRIQSN